MSEHPACLKCQSAYTYPDGDLLVCPECGFEWHPDTSTTDPPDSPAILDANGHASQDGDAVRVIKALKVKGSSLIVKVGTKEKNIRLVEDDNNIDYKITGVGEIKLKSQFVKKV